MRGFWTLAIVVVVAGCGGGGGGGSTGGSNLGDSCPGNPAGKLNYTTTWGSVPATASQVILVKDANGAVLRSDSLNRNGAANSSLPTIDLPSGVYEVNAVLYPQGDANGAPLKELSTVISFCGPTNVVNVKTLAAESAVSLTVNPGIVRLTQNQTRRFVATATGGSGNPAFVPFGSIKWSVQGGIGTISNAGVLTATNAGTGKVRAAVTNPALSGDADVTVDKFVATRGKWTVLVFMNAANNLQPDSELNMNQMETVAGNPDVRFVVQWKESRSVMAGSTFDGVRRYLVKPDNDLNQVHSQLVQDHLVDGLGNPLDMGSPSVLLDFVQWGKLHYPADRYVLVIWNHGDGWKRDHQPTGTGSRGFSYDDQSFNHIDTWQIDQALAGQHFDILAWDASLMQMCEVAYEARNHADYIVGSEESPPEQGYPYDVVFKAFRDTPNASTTSLTKSFVDGMLNNPLYASRKITQSVVDTSKLPALASAVDTLGHQLFTNKTALANLIVQTRTDAQTYSPTSSRFYCDLGDVCRLLKLDNTIPASVRNAATGAQDAEKAAMVWEGHNSHSANSTGVSIDFSAGSVFQQFRPDYIQMKWAKDTFWDEYLGTAP